MTEFDSDALNELVTLRDWLRYGTTHFTRSRLVFGHGTARAQDEAAFLILMALDLPVDALEPFVDARLTQRERKAIAELFQRRIETRKPAAYLVNAAFIQGHRFYVDERVIVPRSYIGELLCDGLPFAIEDPAAVGHVLDLCTGSGCLAILAALAFTAAHVDAVDLSPDALAVAARNVADYGLEGRVSLVASNLYAALPPGRRYDLIIANPPYVATAEVAAFDPEYRAEPEMAHLGGADGLDLVHLILKEALSRLDDAGTLVMEIGTGRAAFDAAYPDLDVIWLLTQTSHEEVFAVTAEALASGLAAAPKAKRSR